VKTSEIAKRIKRDNMKLARYSRGVLLWAATATGQVLAVGIDAASTWTPKQWGARLLVAGLAGAAGLVTAGERNAK
jgi:hypothetical protein